MSKPKYDKLMCLQCIYHQETPGTGYPIVVKDDKGREKVLHVHCNYLGVTRESCLQDSGAGRVVDIRGDGPDCNLFRPGEVQKSKVDDLYFGNENKENIYK